MSKAENLKAGDEVGIIRNMDVELGRVSRTTKTLIIVVRKGNPYEYRFRKSDGYETSGNEWHRACVRPATEEMRVDVAKKNLNHKVKRLCDTILKFSESVTKEECEQLQTIAVRLTNL